VPALEPNLIEPVWQQFCELLPKREVDHPLGCHRPRIPDGVVFERLVQGLVFGCAYHRIADERVAQRPQETGVVYGAQREGDHFWVVVSDVVIIVRRLIREGWRRYRWDGRPSRRP
jgi:hypothetical protein